MKRFILLWLLPLTGQAQGIAFEKGSSWEQVKLKARTEHKYIFMDCGATWCVPCRYMNEKVFSSPEVGMRVDSNFVSISVQMDSTAKDDEQTRAWYMDARNIKYDYVVNAFPTYLFFDPEGKIVHRAGGSMPAGTFLKMCQDALRPETQFYTLLEKSRNGSRDSAITRPLTEGSVNIGDEVFTAKLLSDYMGSVRDIYGKDNLQFIGRLTKSSREPGFKLWMSHTAEVNKVMGDDYAQRKMMNIIMSEDSGVKAANQAAVAGLKSMGSVGGQEVYEPPAQGTKEPLPPDWEKMRQGISRRYNAYFGDRITKWIKLYYYKQRESWKKYDAAVVGYLDVYQATVNPNMLNEFAWAILTHSNDQLQLQKAVLWSRASLSALKDTADRYIFLDTYANLLYRTGRRKEAIVEAEKALLLAPEQEKAAYSATLTQMKANR